MAAQKRLGRRTVLVIIALAVVGWAGARAEDRPRSTFVYPGAKTTLIGRIRRHVVQPGETFLDIARKYDVAITKLQAFYPAVNPWVLKEGNVLWIPTLWILPRAKGEGIVINVPELRLYYFDARHGTVVTYPVTVGEKETPTPVGTFRIVDRQIDPEWNIPPRLQYKYQRESVPPGEDNPIGKYWLALSRPRYGIHGTDNPWSVGRVISNGCIRLYPEDMERLFNDVPKETMVYSIYEPVKYGFKKGEIFIEVHEDIYGRIRNMERHARNLAKKMKIEDHIDWEKVQIALAERSGVPVPVGALPEGGGGEQSSRHR